MFVHLRASSGIRTNYVRGIFSHRMGDVASVDRCLGDGITNVYVNVGAPHVAENFRAFVRWGIAQNLCTSMDFNN